MMIHEQIDKIFADNDVKGFASWIADNQCHCTINQMRVVDALTMIATLAYNICDSSNLDKDKFCSNLQAALKFMEADKKCSQ